MSNVSKAENREPLIRLSRRASITTGKKVIVENVFESFCLQVTNSLKAKKKKEGEKKLFGDLGIWWVEKKYL